MARTRRSTADVPVVEKDGAISQVERRRRAALREGGASFHARRTELLTVAAHVFREKGVSRMSLADVAQRAQVDRATIYYYFRSKDDLFRVLIEEVVIHNVEEIEAIAASDDSPAVKLRSAIEALMVSFAVRDPFAAVYVEEFLPRDRPGAAIEGFEEVRSLGRRYDRAMREIVRLGCDAGLFRRVDDERTVAAMIIGMMNSSVRWQRSTDVDTARRCANSMADLVLGGLEEPGGRSGDGAGPQSANAP